MLHVIIYINLYYYYFTKLVKAYELYKCVIKNVYKCTKLIRDQVETI